MRRGSIILLIIIILSPYKSCAISEYQQEWQQVIAEKNSLVKQTEEDSLVDRYELAVAYANLGDIEEANAIFKSIDDKEHQKILEEIIKEYESRLKQESKNIKVNNYLAFAYYINHQLNKAEEQYQKILKLDSKNIWSYNYLAVVQHMLKDYKEAQKTLNKSMDIEENEYTHFLMAANYYKRGSIFKAFYHFGKGKKAAKIFLTD